MAAFGVLAKAALASNVVTALPYVVPAATGTTASLILCNRSSTPAKVRVAITSAATPADSDWIEYDSPLAANRPLQLTALVMGAGEKVFVYAAGTAVSARLMGFEEAVI